MRVLLVSLLLLSFSCTSEKKCKKSEELVEGKCVPLGVPLDPEVIEEDENKVIPE